MKKEKRKTKNTVEIIVGVKEGKKYKIIKLNGEEKREPYTVSRIITGTDSENTSGVFTSSRSERFVKGDFEKVFDFGEEIDWYNEDIDTIKRKLINRIKQVRDWVKSLDFEKRIKIEI